MIKKSHLENTYMKCRAQLVKVIGNIVDRDDIEDLVQETFVKSYEAELKQEIKFERTYMLKTAKNLALNHVTKASARKNQSLENLQSLPTDLTSISLESQFETKERFLHFCHATDTLTAEVKRVFLLKKVYGLSQKDIAQSIGLSESTVEKHVAKGLLLCANYIEQLTNPGDSPHKAVSNASEQVNK